MARACTPSVIFSEQTVAIACEGTTETLAIASLGVFGITAEGDGGRDKFPGLVKTFEADAVPKKSVLDPVAKRVPMRVKRSGTDALEDVASSIVLSYSERAIWDLYTSCNVEGKREFPRVGSVISQQR